MGRGLGSELTSLLDPTPKEFFNEDDQWDKPTVDSDIELDDEVDTQNDGRLAMRADISLLEGKYRGVASSRKNFGMDQSSDDDSDELEAMDQSAEEEESEESEEEEIDQQKRAMHDIHTSVFREAEELASQMQKEAENDAPGITLVNSMGKELLKSQHTKNQQKIWDSVLKLRIKQQRSLTMANRLPQRDMLTEFCNHNTEIKETRERISESIQELLELLLVTGYEIRSQHTQCAESIPNDISELFGAVEDGSSVKKAKKRRRNFFSCPNSSDPSDFYWDALEQYSTSANSFYKDTFDYWQQKTQLSARISQTKFKAINQSIPAQIDAVMNEPDKLIEKTQYLASTKASVFGKEEQGEVVKTNNGKVKDCEIFDDSTFYQNLLKSLVEQDVSQDPTEVTRSWLKARDQNKKRKVYNSRLSKDRVLKFHVHEKLVDFTTPTGQEPPEYADDLFQNLFK